MLYALLAAALFGAGIPLCKALGATWPQAPLAGMLYLVSGVGLLAARPLVRAGGEPLARRHLGWLAGSVLTGGILAPICLLYGLTQTYGHVASILGNLETVFTVAIAVMLFRERLQGREWLAALLLVAGAAAVSWSGSESQAKHPWFGAGLIALSCLCWGFDNNFTRRIAECDPLVIGGAKGLAAGVVNLAVGAALGQRPPMELRPLAFAGAVGLFSYGISLVLFVLALRKLGAARTSAVFAIAPASGVLVAWLALREVPGWPALAGGAVMIAGVVWLALAGEPPDGEKPEAHASLPG